MNAILILAACLAGSLQDPAPDPARMRALVKKLESEEPALRESAEAELRKIGRASRELLAGEAKGASPEAAARLKSILRGFETLDREEDAIRMLRKSDPLPRPHAGQVRIDGEQSVAKAIAGLAGAFDLKIEFQPGEEELRRRAEDTPLNITYSSANESWVLDILQGMLAKRLEACWVVDGERLVIVRMTPGLLLERLRSGADPRGRFEILRRLAEFEGPQYQHGLSAGSFIQDRVKDSAASRDRWAEALSTVALSPDETLERRLAAVRGCTWFYGVLPETQPRIAETLVRIYNSPKTPAELRAEAGRSLCSATDPEALDVILKTLESGPAADASVLLAALLERHYYSYAAVGALRRDREREARLAHALQALEGSPDADLALRSTSLCATLSFLSEVYLPAAERLAKAPDPKDPQTAELFLEGLRVAAFKVPTAVLPRVRELSRSPDARVRASAAMIFGRSVGGKDRKADIEGSLALLKDPEPLVRWAAAQAIGYVFSTTAAERYLEGWESVEPKLLEAQKDEKHPKVREALAKALDEGRR